MASVCENGVERRPSDDGSVDGWMPLMIAIVTRLW